MAGRGRHCSPVLLRLLRFDSNQDWYLDGLNSASRKFWVSFDSAVAGSPSNPLPDTFVRGTWRTLCSAFGDTQALGGMAAGQSKLCGMIFSFNFNNTTSTDYRVAFNPARQAGSDDVLIQCLGAGTNGKCNHWTIDPQSSTAIGALLRITYSRGGTMTLTPVGQYYYRFHIDVMNPANP